MSIEIYITKLTELTSRFEEVNKSITDLETKIAEKKQYLYQNRQDKQNTDEEIKSLQKKLDKHSSFLKSKHREVDILRPKKHLEAVNEKISSSESELTNLKTHFQNIKAKISISNSLISEINSKLENYQDRFNQNTQNITEFKLELGQKNTEINNKSNEKGGVRRKVQQKLKDLFQIKNVLNSKYLEIQNIKQYLESLRSSYEQAHEDKDRAESKKQNINKSQYTKTVYESYTYIGNFCRDVDKTVRKGNIFESTMTPINPMLIVAGVAHGIGDFFTMGKKRPVDVFNEKDYNRALNSIKTEIQTYQNQIDNIYSEIESAKTKLSEAENKFSQLAEEKEKVELQLGQLENNETSLDEELNALKTTRAEFEQENSQLENESEEVNYNLEVLNTRLQQFTEGLKQYQKERSEVGKNISRVAKQKRQLENKQKALEEYCKLCEQIEDSQKLSEEYESNQEQVLKEYRELQKLLQSSAEDKQALTGQIEEVVEQAELEMANLNQAVGNQTSHSTNNSEIDRLKEQLNKSKSILSECTNAQYLSENSSSEYSYNKALSDNLEYGSINYHSQAEQVIASFAAWQIDYDNPELVEKLISDREGKFEVAEVSCGFDTFQQYNAKEAEIQENLTTLGELWQSLGDIEIY